MRSYTTYSNNDKIRNFLFFLKLAFIPGHSTDIYLTCRFFPPDIYLTFTDRIHLPDIYRQNPFTWHLAALCLVLHFEEMSSCFLLNVFWGYFALIIINGPNCEVICIIPIFGVIFGENLGIWPPGVTIYGFTPYCFPINFEEMSPCFVLDVFCVHFSYQMVQVGKLFA